MIEISHFLKEYDFNINYQILKNSMITVGQLYIHIIGNAVP